MKFNTLTVNKSEDLIFGFAPNPVTNRRGLNIGGGIVYPESNFTLHQCQLIILRFRIL